jgi:RHS repeat-associated protein
LLVTANAAPDNAAPDNAALASNGSTATASSTLSPYVPAYVINGSRRATNSSVWLDSTYNSFPDWVQVDFNGSKIISEIDVITQQDDPQNPIEPTLTQTFSLYGITAFDVQYWTGSAWATVPGGSVTGNNKVWRQFTFSPITTSKIRVMINAGADNAFSRMVEVEAWTSSSTGNINWLVTDHLGTPRMTIDQSGSVATVKRHDYLPFGEELFTLTGLRTTALGYSGGDGVRQQFTSKERDNETGLDYFAARYYSSGQGRFLSKDPLNPLTSRRNDQESEQSFLRYIAEPGNWNGYSYVRNNPLRHIDPDGRSPQDLIPSSNLVDALSAFTTTITVSQRIAVGVTRTVLNLVFGAPIEVIPGGLAKHEIAFANQVTQYTQSTFVGVATRNQPGIDGILVEPGSIETVRGVASLTETVRDNPRVLIDLAQDKEASAQKGGYKNVDLFIKATGLDSKTVVEYVNRGSAITNVASGGTIRSINIFTNDNHVVRVEGQKITVCDENGQCH